MARSNSNDYLDNYFGWGIDQRRRRLFLGNDELTEDTGDIFIKGFQLLESHTSTEPIEIFISTFGGSVFELFSIYDMIRASKSHVVTVGYGKIMSAGTLLLSCGDERKAYPNTQFMIHEMSYELGYDKHTVNESEVSNAKQMNDRFLHLLAKCTNKTFKQWKALTHSRPDKYFSAEEALSWGLIDKIIETD
jgi:ATP-dependent Clp protease protease subunit